MITPTGTASPALHPRTSVLCCATCWHITQPFGGCRDSRRATTSQTTCMMMQTDSPHPATAKSAWMKTTRWCPTRKRFCTRVACACTPQKSAAPASIRCRGTSQACIWTRTCRPHRWTATQSMHRQSLVTMIALIATKTSTILIRCGGSLGRQKMHCRQC